MKLDMQPTPPQLPESTSIRDRVFCAIADQKVEPRPCYVFWCQNSAMWLIWLLTVLLGALATAVLLFTSTYRYYDIYEAMHDNFVTFFLQALPLLWIVAFVVLMLVAMRGLRATRRGYRLSPVLVGGSSVGVSVLLGLLASTLGFGFVVDRALGEHAPMYRSLAEQEQQMWQQPDEGRLVGQAAGVETREQMTVQFVDSAGVAWNLDIQELRPQDHLLLESAQRVRVLGMQLEGEVPRFHACGVFPWMADQNRPRKVLSAGRQESVDKMYAHSYTPADRLAEFEQLAFADARADNVPSMKICASIAAVKRITEQMQ